MMGRHVYQPNTAIGWAIAVIMLVSTAIVLSAAGLAYGVVLGIKWMVGK